MSKSIVRIRGKGKSGRRTQARQAVADHREPLELDSRVEVIQALIPLGLEAVNELLQQESPRWRANGTAVQADSPATPAGSRLAD